MKEHTLFISWPGGAELIILMVILAMVIFWIRAIIDIAKSRFKDDTTKIVWLLIVIFTGFLGALIYIFVGKQNKLV